MGNLRLMVKKVLSEKPSSGYEIVKMIEEKTGWKPSFGSVYPLLDDMTNQGLIDHVREGRRKVYHLTEEGLEKMDCMSDHSKGMYQAMQEHIKVMGEVTNQDVSDILQMIDRFHSGENPFKDVQPELFEFRNTIFNMCFDGRAEKNSKNIKKLLKGVNKKLQGMK
ncbi:PadR family transcriptional regulator [Nanoarchaeota archaeon]